MRGVLLEVPPALLAERARLGIDVFDEMWEGELHLAPPPSEEHQRIGTKLVVALDPVAEDCGMLARYETGLFDPSAPEGSDYRVPDLVVFAAGRRSDRGVEGGAALVVEIRSPGDESLEKLAFYERVGVGEVLVIDRDSKGLRHWSRVGDELVETDVERGVPVVLSGLAVTMLTTGGRLVVETPMGRTLI